MKRIVLIGCGKLKRYTYDDRRGGRVLPHELYCSDLFRKRVDYAEARGLEWYVLSARFGLWQSNREMNPCEGSEYGRSGSGEPYDFRLSDLLPGEQSVWFSDVAYHVVELLWEDDCAIPMHPQDLTVEIHAGGEYADRLERLLLELGLRVEVPCRGLGIGEQLAWYKGLKHESANSAG